MRWLARAVGLLFLLWLVVIVAGALGVGPAGHVPFGSSLGLSSEGPPSLRHLPAQRQPSRSDLTPALSATAFASAVRSSSPVLHPAGKGHSASAPGHQSAITTKTRGHSASAPGHATKTTTTHGRSGSAPGHASTTTTTTTTKSRGHSGSAPGHTTKTAPPGSTKRKSVYPLRP